MNLPEKATNAWFVVAIVAALFVIDTLLIFGLAAAEKGEAFGWANALGVLAIPAFYAALVAVALHAARARAFVVERGARFAARASLRVWQWANVGVGVVRRGGRIDRALWWVQDTAGHVFCWAHRVKRRAAGGAS